MGKKVDIEDLSVEELERLLVIKRREERQGRLRRMQREGRIVGGAPSAVTSDPQPPQIIPTQPELVPTGTVESTATLRQSVNLAPQMDDAPKFLDGDAEVSKADDSAFWKSFANHALLLVEVLAVFGLLYLGYDMLTSIGTLERETAAAQELAEQQRRAGIPTFAPTPQIRLEDVVLPSGHTPPTEPGGGQFNFSEIPANLLPVVQSQILMPVIERPAPTSETALRLVIPKINVDHTIVQGTDWDALRLGVGQVLNGFSPSDVRGNVVLAAHNDIYGEIFRYLDQLEPGDEFQILTASEVHNYVVDRWEIVAPDDVHIMGERGGATVTLISCYPYQVDNERIAVYATRV